MKDKLTIVSALIDPNILGGSDHAKKQMHEKT
jgi:hypothetical protein